jgi:dTDP-4-dehydrorhamnose 3,5-epimerase
VIDGVIVHPLKQLCDERGKIMHILRRDGDLFQAFGEVYVSVVNPGAIKAWHLHKEMTLNYAVVSGMIKLVLYDDRNDSTTKGQLMELFLGPESYNLVRIPPMVWNGFKGIATQPSLVVNCSTIPHSPEEIVRMSPFDEKIPYRWDIKHG